MSELPISEARDRLEDAADLEAAQESLADPVRVPHREVLADYGIEIT